MGAYRFQSYLSAGRAPELTARLLADLAGNQKVILDMANCAPETVGLWACTIVGPLLTHYTPAQLDARLELSLPANNRTAGNIRKEYEDAITTAKETFQLARYVGGTVEFLPPLAVQPEEPALRAAA